uniref:Putative tick til 3 n=1 Tax=Amblyomma parvum TaxID=251391 RepID=A0A023G155_AMBPA
MASKAILGAFLLVALCTFILQASGRARIADIDHWYPGVRPGVWGPYPWQPYPWQPYPWGPYPWWPYPWGRGCGRNEVYKHCVSSSCSEARCWEQKVGPACTKDCVSGCFCRKGFYRNKKNRCVRWGRCMMTNYPRPPVHIPYPEYPLPGHPYQPRAVPL